MSSKMKRTIILSVMMVAIGAALAVDDWYTGGEVRDMRKQHGKVVIVNCQQSAKAAWLRNAAKLVSDEFLIPIEVEDGTFNLANPATKGTATLFVTDSTNLTMSLIAPEAKWSMLNVAPLKTEKRSVFEMRTMKGVLRALLPILGGIDSQYPCCLMGPAYTGKDLDKFTSLRLPIDVITRVRKNLKAVGIEPWVQTNYRTACEQGWAAPPTNEIQKAVWEDTHPKATDKPAK